MMHAAVVCRLKGFDELRQKLGWWSYDVPDLTWDFIPVDDGDVVDKDDLAREHDLIIWEDWCWPTWKGISCIPVYAVMVDSNTSARRRKMYQGRAKQATALLVDQDDLATFEGASIPAYRWSYGVNEQVFAPRQKEVDVAYHVVATPERGALQDYLQAWLKDHPTISASFGDNLTIDQYAARLGTARIAVHKRTHPQCRSHRYFDALASGCCLLAERGQDVVEDGFIPGRHYLEWTSPTELVGQIADLLESGRWWSIAEAGRAFVLARHTWAHRAAQLVRILEEAGEYAQR